MAKRKLNEKTLSDLLLRAVNDARAVQKRDDVKLNMNKWVVRNEEGICEVCMAGAVMIGLIPRLVKQKGTDPYYFAYNTAMKLNAIDYMRNGDFCLAFYDAFELELKQEQERVLSKITDLVVENYNETLQRASWRTYEKAARMLKKAGL